MADVLKVGWTGYGGNSPQAEELRPVINELGLALFTIHEWDNADIKWDRHTWLNHLREADIIIVPANWKTQSAKSNNRLTQAMSLGKPVIASPLPAYLKVLADHPGSFLLADTPEEWKDALTKLRDDGALRKNTAEIGLRASQDYSIDAMAGKWLDVFKINASVDIVIPTYNNLRGLKLCIESIRRCTNTLHKIIVVNNGTDEEIHAWLDSQGDIIYQKSGRMTFSQAVNAGISAGKSKYVCILNDDVIVSEGWLNYLVDACGDGIGAVGPLSNCDKGWLHNLDINIGGVELLPGTNTFDQIEPIIPQIYSWKSPYVDRPEREWAAFYCTLIPRAVLDKVGALCEEYVNSGEDVDLCRRIKQMGFKIIQDFRSFVFHFGAVSRKGLEAEGYDAYHDADKKTQATLARIWGKKNVVIYSGPSWEKWDHRSLESGIGGSEVWQIWLARELSKLGYRVVSFCDCAEEVMDGDVQYIPFTQFPKYVNEHWIDHLILSRTTDPLDLPVRAGQVFIQIHDIWMLSEKTKTHVDKVTKYCALSGWHLDFAANHHGIPKDRFVLTANGIDFARFDHDAPKLRHKLIWGSSWDRGLDNVLYLLPFIRANVPDVELAVFYGTKTWVESCKRRGDSEGLKKIAQLEELTQQPGVTVYGRVSQQRLALEYKTSSLLLYSTSFSETFWIGGVEAQYAGVPVLANKYAGITTTLGDSALLLGNGDAYWPYTKEGREAFLAEAVSLLTDDVKWQQWSDRGFENAKRYSWANCALRWKRLFDTGE